MALETFGCQLTACFRRFIYFKDKDFVAGKDHIQGFYCGKRSYTLILLWEKGHIQRLLWEKIIYKDFIMGKRSYTMILLWEKVIYMDFVVGKGHVRGFWQRGAQKMLLASAQVRQTGAKVR